MFSQKAEKAAGSLLKNWLNLLKIKKPILDIFMTPTYQLIKK